MLNPADPAFLSRLAEILPPASLRAVNPGDVEEPRGRYHGHAAAVARPGSVEEVAATLRLCHQSRVGVVPVGGGTGLVGGQIATGGALPLLLSLERMTAIRGIWPEENVLIAEAGAIIEDIHHAAEAQDRLFPLQLASQGSARIGGCLSTNAGGSNVLRYGTARELCLGLEAVLPDGTIWHGLKRLRKDNTGYDLRGLLAGAEGTLGVITAASLKLFPRPDAVAAALLAVPGPGAALSLLALARAQLAEGVSAFELIHRQGFDFLAETMPDLRLPFAETPEWMVLIDLGLPRGADAEGALATLFEAGMETDLVSDGVITQSMAQRSHLWTLRESIPEANRLIGAVASHDISLPLSALPAFIDTAGAALARIGDMRINCFGHVGDGNLHYNVFPAPGRRAADYDPLRKAVTETVHDLVDRMGGSFSAEHGVGRAKVGDLERYGDPAKLAAMRAIKAALDPHGIMNPGAMLRG